MVYCGSWRGTGGLATLMARRELGRIASSMIGQ